MQSVENGVCHNAAEAVEKVAVATENSESGEKSTVSGSSRFTLFSFQLKLLTNRVFLEDMEPNED